MSNRNTNNENPLPVDYVIHEYEVYCGCGSHGHHHVGNRNFRQMILQNLERYQAATKQHDKSAILDEIVATVGHNSPHGFIRKDHKTGRFYKVGNFLAVRKQSVVVACFLQTRITVFFVGLIVYVSILVLPSFLLILYVKREKTSQAFRDVMQERSKEATSSNKQKNPTVMSSTMSNNEYTRNDPLSPTPLLCPTLHSQGPLQTKMITSSSDCCLSSTTINSDARQNHCDEMQQIPSASSSASVSSKIACSRQTNQQYVSVSDLLGFKRKMQSNTSNSISHAFHTERLEDTMSILNCLLSPENDWESLIGTNSDVILSNPREYVGQVKGIMSDKEAAFSSINSSVLHSKNSLSANDDSYGTITDSRTFHSPEYLPNAMTAEMVTTAPFNFVKNTSQDRFRTSIVHPYAQSPSKEGMAVVGDITMNINDPNAITFFDSNESSNDNSEQIENNWVRDDATTTMTTAQVLSPTETAVVNNDKSESDYDIKTFDTLFLLTILYPDLETCPFLDPHRISNLIP